MYKYVKKKKDKHKNTCSIFIDCRTDLYFVAMATPHSGTLA